jgi:small subunit ribosomal protein S8
MNYTIGDFVIQLKNAALTRKKELVTPYANIKFAVSKVLIKEGFLEAAKAEDREGRKMLVVNLRYARRKPTLTDVKLISKPSLRVYVESKDIYKKQGRAETAVVSTNLGVITGREAIKKGVGGELLFKVW